MSSVITSRLLTYCRVEGKLPNCLAVEAGCLDDSPPVSHQIAVIILEFSVVQRRLDTGPGDENIMADNDQRKSRSALVSAESHATGQNVAEMIHLTNN